MDIIKQAEEILKGREDKQAMTKKLQDLTALCDRGITEFTQLKLSIAKLMAYMDIEN